MKKIMILGGSEAQLPAVLKAKELGYKTLVCDMYEDAYCKEYADEFRQVSTLDYKSLDKVICDLKPDGIMTIASDRPMPILARLANKYGLNSVSEETAVNATNKYLSRLKLKEHGVAVPYFHKVVLYSDLLEGVNAFNKYPYILKPTGNSGSRGIFKIENESQLETAYKYSSAFNVNGVLILEEFMDGREFSVESFAVDGDVTVIAVTEKITTGAPHFVETGHAIQANITAEERSEIENLIVDVHKALSIDNGPTHIEVILTSTGPKVVETAVRMGGDNISSYLVPLATDFDFVGNTIRQACNDNITFTELKNNSSCVRYIIPDSSRIIKDVVTSAVNCERIYIDKTKIGKKVAEDNSADRLGYIICKGGSNTLETIKKVEDELNKIKIVYDD